MSERVDLDALERHLERVDMYDLRQVGIPIASLIAELRASRKVVEALREANENHLLRYALPDVYAAFIALDPALELIEREFAKNNPEEPVKP